MGEQGAVHLAFSSLSACVEKQGGGMEGRKKKKKEEEGEACP